MYFSCSDNNESTQEQDQQYLIELHNKIQDLASSVTCTDASEWTFTGVGVKPCGGPIGYIAYSTSIDIDIFLEQLEELIIAQREYYRKWGIVSDCGLPPYPGVGSYAVTGTLY